jgi:subtilase family serine protease
MSKKGRRLTISATLFITVVTALVAVLLVGRTGVSAAATPAADSFKGHAITVNPQYKLAQSTNDGDAVVFGCQSATAAPRCFQPAQIRAAYDIQSLIDGGVTGKGRTIAIIDAFQNPSMAIDLSLFDSTFGLPDPVFQQIAPFGLTPFDINDDNMVGWSGEIALDVEWSHAVAPDAKILLVLAKTNDDRDIYNATKYVIDHNLADVISQSFGEGESCVDPKLERAQHDLFVKATQKNITLFASSGDDGAAQPTCDGNSYFKSASSPASDPLVTAVGGTNLFADPLIGTYQSENAWNDARLGSDPNEGFSGGGFSNIYKRPSYQNGVSGTQKGHRGVPDVSYNAGVDGGVLTHWGTGLTALAGLPPDDPHFFIFGGTSAGSPQWAGLTALADQLAGKRLGFLNSALYRLGQSSTLYPLTFHDITTGSNSITEFDVNDAAVFIQGFSATKKWDPVTGWGSPKAQALVIALAFNIRADDGRNACNDHGN